MAETMKAARRSLDAGAHAVGALNAARSISSEAFWLEARALRLNDLHFVQADTARLAAWRWSGPCWP